jgi:acetyl esterase
MKAASMIQTPQPDTQAILTHLASLDGPKLSDVSAPESRDMFRKMCAMLDLPEQDVLYENIMVAGVPCRLYRPDFGEKRGELVVYFHGGGWVFGDVETHHSFCSALAVVSGLRLLSVDYRLAPEFPFPAAHDDSFAVIADIQARGRVAGDKVTAIGVAGDSAGGNISAAAAQHFHHAADVPLKAQWLIYPATDMTSKSQSYRLHAAGYLLEDETMEYFKKAYLPDAAQYNDKRMSPLLAEDVSAVAPAAIFTCGLDPLRDEGRAYAAKLAQSGVNVHFREAYGQIHGIVTLRGGIASAVPPLMASADDFFRLLTR